MCITTYIPLGHMVNYDVGMSSVQNNVDTVDYDALSEGVRRFCAERLYELERSLRPMVDGSFGEVLPGHLNGYLTAIRALGKLYQTDKPPRDVANLVPMVKVQELLARMEAAHDQAVREAVAATESRVRRELANGAVLSIQAAKETVSAKLAELAGRAAS
jgi:hypothetical protein